MYKVNICFKQIKVLMNYREHFTVTFIVSIKYLVPWWTPLRMGCSIPDFLESTPIPDSQSRSQWNRLHLLHFKTGSAIRIQDCHHYTLNVGHFRHKAFIKTTHCKRYWPDEKLWWNHKADTEVCIITMRLAVIFL